MNNRTTYAVIAAILTFAAASLAAADAPDALAKLDAAMKSVPAFEYGKDSKPLLAIEQIVIEASANPQRRAAVEDRLIKALSGDATRDAKEFLCRQLYIIGSTRCVPALEPLLTDAQLSHPARYALGRIDDPGASAALCRALAKTTGNLQAGIIATLAAKHCRMAIPDIARLLSSPDQTVAIAAAKALGQFGGTDAVTFLQSARSAAGEPLASAIDDALLSCADQSLATGDRSRALSIYRDFYAPNHPKRLRIAALCGLAAAGGDNSLNTLAAAIRSDPDLRPSAIAFAAQVKNPAATKVLANLFPTLPASAQELLIVALGARADRSAIPAIAVAAASESPRVRLAACEALAQIGDASCVELLARAATKNSREDQLAARSALLRLAGPGVDDALVNLLAASNPALQAEAARALAGRHTHAAFADLLRLARTGPDTVRRAAIAALGELAAEPDLPSLLSLILVPKSPIDRAAVEQSLGSAFRRIPDLARRAAPILSIYATASSVAQPALLRLLVNAPTPAALALICSAARSPDAALRDAAIRALADWPTAEPADQLLDLARATGNPTHRILAIRGYLRMAGLAKDPTPMYARGMELARDDSDKKLVLAGLASASTSEALALVEQQLANPHIQAEAALAAVQIASRLKDTPLVREAMKKVLAVAIDPSIHQKASDLLDQLELFDDYILTWTVSDIYKENDGETAFNRIYAPETSAAIAWKPLTRGLGQWFIDLESTFGVVDHCTAYVRTRVFSPCQQEARLEMGADDALKVWLNGKEVFAHFQNRGLQPRSDIAPITLRQGWNELLLKVVDQEGAWTFCCRIRRADGSSIEGLRYEAK